MFSQELIIFPSEPSEKKLSIYNHRLKVWLQDCVRDGFWDLEGKLTPFMSHHVVSQLAICFLSNSCWFLVWDGKVCFEMIQHILLGYICLLNLISLLLMWWVPPWRNDFILLLFLRSKSFFFCVFRELRVGIKKEKKSIWKTMDLLVYDPRIEQNQKWSPRADRIKRNLLESSSWVLVQGA